MHFRVGKGSKRIVLGLVLALTSLVGISGCFVEKELNQSSTCREYLNAGSDDQARAVNNISVANRQNSAGNPLLIMNTAYVCGQNPDSSLGDAVAAGG